MLGKRYEHDGEPLLKLNELQQAMKSQIEDKLRSGIYKFEHADCCVCGRCDFQPLSTKDRYGLFVPVVICRDCEFYKGPHAKALGRCRKFNAETAPDFFI